ncbi:MAG: hypothetical protein Pg6C_16840 [Treponemataceae bacterium]|nr:MAG: hypothetical protein Pg6C_16840 [Treponemataceae bacterium]
MADGHDGDILEGNGIEYEVVERDTLGDICDKHPELGYSRWQDLRDVNIEEIRRVGRLKMDELCAYPENNLDLATIAGFSRTVCGIKRDHEGRDHTYHNLHAEKYLVHRIINGVHYDGVDQPTIYPGTKLFIKKNPGKEKPPHKEKEEPPKKGEPITTRRGYGWYRVKHQAPAPKIEVYKPDDGGKAYLTFEAAGKGEGFVSRKLLNYSFSGGVDDLYGAFSFGIETDDIPVDGGEPVTVFDAIPKLSVVKIYEANEKIPVFTGIVKRRSIKSSMSAQGPRRSITISGRHIISVLAEYMVSLDFKIMNIDFAENESRQLTEKLNLKKLTIEDFMSITWEFFWKMGTGENSNAIASTIAGKIIKNHIAPDWEKSGIIKCLKTGAVKNIHYPIANSPFNQGNNVISELWRNILPQPIYELYAYSERETGDPKIMAREVPFGFKATGNKDWYALPIYEIDPLGLIDYNITQSDEEVYTVFSAYLIGSAFSREYNIAKSADKQDDRVANDKEKMGLYGYKPLEVSFRGYDTQGTESDDLQEVFKQLNEKAKYWYGRLDDMYSGTITVITDFIKREGDELDKNPRYGCRAKFLGGEFYITHAEHRWQYGGTPTITLTITRGMKYDKDGYMGDKNDGVLKDIGRQFKELESETE